MHYTSVDIIYNPNSTGPSKDYAKDLYEGITAKFPDVSIHLRGTKRAGHAEQIAYDCSRSSKKPLIISSSGDGGYNEVINGALKAQIEGAKPTCAVLAAGNANDHSRTLQNDSLLDAIIGGKEESIDILEIGYTGKQGATTRFAHSYIGFGLTPVVAVELNKTSLSAFKELWIVLNTFRKYRPFKLKIDGTVQKLDSILFANIGEMAKVLTISKNAKPNDGKFEIVIFPHAHKLRLIKKLIKAAVMGLEQAKHYEQYKFTVLKDMPAQLDGEVIMISSNTEVKIHSRKRLLRTIL